MIELLLGWLDRYPIVSIEDPLGRGRPRRLRRASRAQSARACRSSATTSSSPMRRACARPPRSGAAQRGAAQAQPARHAHRDARRLAGGRAGGLRRHRLGALRRDRGHRPSSISPSAGAPASSRSARSRAASAWRSGTRRCASRSGSGRARASRGPHRVGAQAGPALHRVGGSLKRRFPHPSQVETARPLRLPCRCPSLAFQPREGGRRWIAGPWT